MPKKNQSKSEKRRIEIQKKLKTGILDKVKVINVITAKFTVQQLVMGKDLRWKMDLSVQRILPKSFHDYRLKMVFDEEPYQKRIVDLEQQINTMRADKSLFPDMTEGQINLKKDEISTVMDDRDEKKKNCPTTEFLAEVEHIKYNAAATLLRVRVPDDIIGKLNENKFWFSYYKLELEPTDIQIDQPQD